MLQLFAASLLTHWAEVFVALALVWLARNYFNRGLQKYDGPVLAALTDWWRVFNVRTGASHETQIKLHERYGDIVRLGPNLLSFSNPNALSDIYGVSKPGFVKSALYEPLQLIDGQGRRVRTVFTTRDEEYHGRLRRAVYSYFSMSSILHFEPTVDQVTTRFLAGTERFFARGETICDLAQWLRFYALDAIALITWSRNLGFVDCNEDVEGITKMLDRYVNYTATVGQMPFLDRLLAKNPVLVWLSRLNIARADFPMVRFAKARMLERLAQGDKRSEVQDATHKDLMSMFLRSKEQDPSFFDDGRVVAMCLTMTLAGSDTVAGSMSAVFYHLLRNPTCYRRLVSEIDSVLDGTWQQDASDEYVSWVRAQSMPYLDACIKEAFRLYAAVGFLLERVVPSEGAVILGHHIPKGTIVGCNAWVINRHAGIFGEEAEQFRPERWLKASPEARKTMEGTLFHFGMGSRTCLGKNIGLLEMYKLIPEILRRYEVTLAEPEKQWKLHNAWFVKPEGLRVCFKARQKTVSGGA